VGVRDTAERATEGSSTLHSAVHGATSCSDPSSVKGWPALTLTSEASELISSRGEGTERTVTRVCAVLLRRPSDTVTDISDVVLTEAAEEVTFTTLTETPCSGSRISTGHTAASIGATPRQLHPKVNARSDRRSPGKSRS
jgi:hypothetical protein